MNMRYRIVLLLILLLIVGQLSAQDEDGLDVQIEAAPIVEDEAVTVNLIVQRADSTTPGNLTLSNITISEDAEDVQLERVSGRPLALSVIVNLSNGSELPLIQNTLNAYFNAYYRPQDRVIFYIFDSQSAISTPRVEEPEDAVAIEQIIRGLTVGSNFYNISTGLTDSLAWLQSVTQDNPTMSRQALVISPFLNTVSEADDALIYAEAQTRLHVVQAHSTHAGSTATLRALAANGGGAFVNNRDDNFVVNGEAVGDLKTLYDTIAENRVIYQLRYRPTGLSSDLNRNATITVTTSSNERGQIDFAYEWVSVPPMVQFVSPSTTITIPYTPPTENNIDRQGVLEIPVIVRVTFPDGAPREIESLRVEVIDSHSTSANVVASPFRRNLPFNENGEYEVPVVLDGYALPGSFVALQIKVRLQDELGFVSNAVRDVNLTVGRPTPVPTFTPDPTVVALTANPPGATTGNSQNSVVLSEDALTLLLGGVAILAIWVIYLILSLSRQRRDRGIAPPPAPVIHAPIATEDVSPIVDSPPEELVPGPFPAPAQEEQELYGRLVVTQGLGVGEILIDRREFVIGRSEEQGAHYVIDLPYVHKRHCMFVFNRNGRFTVRDLGSKNGTFVEGERIPPNQDVPVPFESEIDITKNIKVMLYDPEADVTLHTIMDSEHGIDRTTDPGLRFKPFLQVNYPDDDNEIPQNYSPI